MSQVAKSASAFVRAFLAILVLELEDMVVRLVYPPKLAGVHGDRWTVRTSRFGTFETRRNSRCRSALRCRTDVARTSPSRRDCPIADCPPSPRTNPRLLRSARAQPHHGAAE